MATYLVYISIVNASRIKISKVSVYLIFGFLFKMIDFNMLSSKFFLIANDNSPRSLRIPFTSTSNSVYDSFKG